MLSVCPSLAGYIFQAHRWTRTLAGQSMFSFLPSDYIIRETGHYYSLLQDVMINRLKKTDREWAESRRGLSERQTDIKRERVFPVMRL